MAEVKSKILIIIGPDADYYIVKFIVEASAKAGHSTFVLVGRQSTMSDPGKRRIFDYFMNFGVTLVYRFFPSEFGFDTAHANVVEPARSAILAKQVQIRRVIEAAGIPYTYVIALGKLGLTAPSRDKICIFGDGNVKVVFSMKKDIGTYTIKAVDDPTTLNKSVFIKPPQNIHSMNQLVALWENKAGKTLEKVYVPEEKLLKEITESLIDSPSLWQSTTQSSSRVTCEIDPSWGVEASELYPDVKYTTVEEYIDQFLRHYS